jgi:hypothetical protein
MAVRQSFLHRECLSIQVRSPWRSLEVRHPARWAGALDTKKTFIKEVGRDALSVTTMTDYRRTDLRALWSKK